MPSGPEWYMPASVLGALWGEIMPKLAAAVWADDIKFPDGEPDDLGGGLLAYPLEGEPMVDFWRHLASKNFGGKRGYLDSEDDLREPPPPKGPRFSAAQRKAHFVLEYFHQYVNGPHEYQPPQDQRLKIRVINATGYDFILHSNGLDLFIPPHPFKGADEGSKEEKKALANIYRLYRFRETGESPIALPGVPASPREPSNGTQDYFIPIPLLGAPTGPSREQRDWIERVAPTVNWWLTGVAYRGIMDALPRIIAAVWHEELVWGPKEGDPNWEETYNYRYRTDGGLKQLLQERLELILPKQMEVEVKDDEGPDLPGWNWRDVMITEEGFYFPDPGEAPDKRELLDAIQYGVSGNPVFTLSGECDGE